MQIIRTSRIIEGAHRAARLRLNSRPRVKNPRVVIRNQHDACYSRGSPKRKRDTFVAIPKMREKGGMDRAPDCPPPVFSQVFILKGVKSFVLIPFASVHFKGSQEERSSGSRGKSLASNLGS